MAKRIFQATTRLGLAIVTIGTACTASAQYWKDNKGDELIPSATDIAKAKSAQDPFKGMQGVDSVSFQAGATNNILIQALAGKVFGGTATNDGKESRVSAMVTAQVGDLKAAGVGTCTIDFGCFSGKLQLKDTGKIVDASGAMFRGGFALDTAFQLADGYSIGWVQIFQENALVIGKGAWTIDAGKDSPLYIAHSVPTITDKGNMAAGLTDLPTAPADVPITRQSFYDVLVVYKTDTPTKLFELGSFLWVVRYDANRDGNKGVTSVDVDAFQTGVFGHEDDLQEALATWNKANKGAYSIAKGGNEAFAKKPPMPMTTRFPVPSLFGAVILGALAPLSRSRP